MADFPVSPNARYCGRCIYCGESVGRLSREHVVPYSLNGQWVITKGSCAQCAEITKSFEGNVINGLWPSVRRILGFQSRRNHDRGQSWPLVIERDGDQFEVSVEPEQYPLHLAIPNLYPISRSALPGAERDLPDPMLQFWHVAGPSLQEACRTHGADFVGARVRYYPEEFRRMLAKIAVGAVVYAHGPEPLVGSEFPASVVDPDATFAHCVGAWHGEQANGKGHALHEMRVKSTGKDLHVVIRLFAQFGAPEFHVDLGPADAEFVDSEHWPFRTAGDA